MLFECQNSYHTPCKGGCDRCGLPHHLRPGPHVWASGSVYFAKDATGKVWQSKTYRTPAMAASAARRALKRMTHA